MSISSDERDNYLILYREVQSEDSLEPDVLDEEGEVNSIEVLLDDVRSNVEGFHALEDLDVSSFFKDWISTILANSEDINDGVDDELEQILEYLAENFSKSMLSRARERGKYVVFIVTRGRLIVCHSFTGKKALTTDMDVIEELLSTSNIDKFAEFQFNQDNDIVVNHFDRHDTQSFTDWLGIPENEVAFDIKGDVRIYTRIDEIDVVFEFDQDDITSKLLGSDDYDLSDGMLQTPNEPARRINRVRWGYDVFDDVSEFKNELFRVSHNLARAFDLYDEEISNSIDSFFDVGDHESKIIKDKGESIKEIPKPKVDFELVYVNKQVKMDLSWRKDLAKNLFTNHDPIPMCHAGGDFSESPLEIGNFRIYNEAGLTDSQQTYVNDLLKTARDLGSENLRPLFVHIVFELLHQTTRKPIRYLFKEFADEFESQFRANVQDGSRILQTEGEEIELEWKSPPWFDRKSNPDKIAEGINREFQTSRLLLLGINEDAKEVDVIASGVSDEELEDVETKLENEYDVGEAHVWSVPIDGGHAVVALNIDKIDGYQGDISVLFEEA